MSQFRLNCQIDKTRNSHVTGFTLLPDSSLYFAYSPDAYGSNKCFYSQIFRFHDNFIQVTLPASPTMELSHALISF